jgi:DNA-binding MurR/RpiR family transcriptional regulator
MKYVDKNFSYRYICFHQGRSRSKRGTKIPELLQQILDAYPRLSKGQRQVADYLCRNYRETVFLTASQIGREVGVSTSTVTRLAVSLGCRGFPEFQEAFRDLVRAERSTVSRLRQATGDGTDGRSVVARVFAEDLENLRLTHREMDYTALDRAATAIMEGRQVYIAGLRSTHALALLLHFGLGLSLGTARLLVPGIGDLPEQMSGMGKGDVLVAISFARYLRQTLEIVMRAKERDVTIVAITDQATSPLALQAEISLVARTNLKSIIESYVSPLSLINSLVTLIASRNPRSMQRLSEFESLWKELDVYL